MIGDVLISLLRQLRAGYAQRPQAFPQALILCGVRDLRDYRIQSSTGEVLTGGSAFNIKAASLRHLCVWVISAVMILLVYTDNIAAQQDIENKDVHANHLEAFNAALRRKKYLRWLSEFLKSFLCCGAL